MPRRAIGFLLAVLLAAPAGAASAHGREPMVGSIVFDPTDRDHLVARATWTLLESHDGGESWFGRCANAVGYDRTTEDPAIVIVASGEMVAGTFDGVVVSHDDACQWSLSSDPDATGTYTIDVDRDPRDPRGVWAVQSPGSDDNTLIHSTDEGLTWDVVSIPGPRATPDAPVLLLERVVLSPSDPMRVYVSGAVPASAASPMRHAFFYRSEDGGESFVGHEIPLETEERNAHVLAVDPTNADRIFMRMTRRVTDLVPERLLLSEDGGDTWSTVASLLEITGFAISDDGLRAWVGGWDGAFLRSTDRGLTFAPVPSMPDLRVRCLSWRAADGAAPEELWVCVDDIVGPYAIARSLDGGDTLEGLWTFADASPATGCGECTPVGATCPIFWPDVVFDLGLRYDGGTEDAFVPFDHDAGLPLACIDGAVLDMDAGTSDAGPPPPSGNCGCHAVAPRSRPGLALFVALALLLARRERRRSGRNPARANATELSAGPN